MGGKRIVGVRHFEVTTSASELRRLSDEELLRRVARIDTEALGALYDRHRVVAFSLARRMVGVAGAEDTVQDAFMDLWRSASRYDAARGPVRAWLLGIVRNRSLDALRRLSVQERRSADATRLEDWLPAPDATDDDALRAEASTAVRTALATLPPDQLKVLVLAYFGGWSQTEIAERLRVPLGTVKGRTRLALDKLRTALEGSAHAPG